MATSPKKPTPKLVEAPAKQVPRKPMTPRESLLTQAMQITTGDRNNAYGSPEDNFKNIAEYWSAYLTQSAKTAIILSPQDVAHLMILMKVARLATNPLHEDSLLDVAGYAACGYDCLVADQSRQRAGMGQADTLTTGD